MPKEILIYGAMSSDTATLFVQQMQEVEPEEGLQIRMNCIGGEPEYGWGMASKFSEYTGPKKVLVDGQAASMGMFFLCYADNKEAYDVSEFLIHRCAYSPWIESNPDYFTDAMKENLTRVNASLQKALANTIDVKAFEALPQMADKGIKFKDIFSLDTRIDVYLSAADAKKIGLIDKVLKLTPQKAAEINSLAVKHAGVSFKKVAAKEDSIEDNSKKTITMTIEKLKTEFPAVFAEAVNVGVKQERDRVKSCLVFQEIDPEGVKKAIESGEALTETQKSEFALKTFNKAAIAKVEGANADDVKIDAEKEAKAKEEKDKQTDAFLKEAGLKK